MIEHCFHCGAEATQGWRFCRECGTGLDIAPVANRAAFCTECGNDLAESWRFCTRCGTQTPVANEARSVHLTAEEMSRLTGVPIRSEEGAQASPDRPSVELISRRWDVIDLRPVEDDDSFGAPPPPDELPPPPSRPRPIDAPPTRAAIGTPAAGEAQLDTYRPSEFAGQLAQLAFLALGMVAVATIIGLVILNNRLEEFGSTGVGGFARVETAQRVVDVWLRLGLAVFGVLSVAFLIVWTHRVYGNLRAFGKTDLRAPVGAGIWAWFIPVANLVLPKQLIDDAWRGADVYAAFDPNWRSRPGNRWTLVLWLSVLAFVVLAVVGGVLGADTVERAMDANAWAMMGYGFLVLASLSAVRLIGSITERQETRYRGLIGIL